MKTMLKIIFAITALMNVAGAQVPLLNRVGTTIYPWRAGDKFSDSLLSANAALLNKNNVFTGAMNTFNAINLLTALDTAYSNSVSNVKAYTPITVATSGKTKFISADTSTATTGLTTLYQNSLKLNTASVGSMAYADSAKYHGSASINTVGTITSGTWQGAAIDTTYLNAVANVSAASPLAVAASGKTKFLSLFNLGSMYYVDSTKYHGSASINTVGALASGSIAPGFGAINIGSNTINSGAITSSGPISLNSASVSTSIVGIKGTNTKANLQTWERSGSSTTVASIDTNGSVMFNNTSNTSARFYWDAAANGNAGVLSLSYLVADRVSQRGTDLQLGAPSMNGSTYITGGTSSSGSIQLGSSNSSFTSTGYVGVKASNSRPNVQEWYRSSSATAVASIDTNGSITISPDGANSQAIIALKGRGGANEQYSNWITTANARVRVNPSFEVLDGSANPNTGSSSFLVNNSGLVSIGIPTISNTARFQVKSFTNHPNIQEWYRSGSNTAIAIVDTSGNITGSKFLVSTINVDPSSPSDTGAVGEIRFASGHIYVCVAVNTWKRVAISSW